MVPEYEASHAGAGQQISHVEAAAAAADAAGPLLIGAEGLLGVAAQVEVWVPLEGLIGDAHFAGVRQPPQPGLLGLGGSARQKRPVAIAHPVGLDTPPTIRFPRRQAR